MFKEGMRFDKYYWIKVFCLIIFVVFTNRDFNEQLTFFSLSDNPVRNVSVFLFIWALVVITCYQILFHSNIKYRLLFSLLIIISASFNEFYFSLSNSSIQYSDVTNLWLSRADAKSAFLNYGELFLPDLFILGVGFLSFMLPVQCELNNKSVDAKKRSLKTLIILFLFFITYSIIFSIVSLKGGAAAKGLPEQFKSLALFFRVLADEMQDDFNSERKKAPLNKTRRVNAPHILYIVDESVRADFIDLNNQSKNVTPFLKSISQNIINYGYAASGHNCSHFSNAMLRFGVSSTHPVESLKVNPSLWDFARQSGYNTVYFDVQKRMGTMQNFMTLGERKLINEFIQLDVEQIEKLPAFVQKDIQMAKKVKIILERKIPQFIYVNKEGVHMPYEGKYPESESIFTPHMKLSDSITTGLKRNLLINSYRNAIHWSVDMFFKELLENLDLKNTVIIYTSDHGQNLLDKGLGTHCSTNEPAETVSLVPLFILSEHQTMQKLRLSQSLFFNRSTHFNIAPTILRIFNYEKEVISESHDSSLFSIPQKQRVMFTGNITKGISVKKHELTLDALID